MKILVATKKTQGARKNDFSFAEESEPVCFGSVCDGAKVDDKCGCKRVMIGMRSRRGTTTVVVVDIEIDLVAEMTASLKRAWGVDPTMEEVTQRVNDLTRIASGLPVGMVFEIRGAKIQERREKTAGAAAAAAVSA